MSVSVKVDEEPRLTGPPSLNVAGRVDDVRRVSPKRADGRRHAERRFRLVSVRVELDPGQVVAYRCRAVVGEQRA